MANDLSSQSIIEATRGRAKFSGHGNALGAAGYRAEGDGRAGEFLSAHGDTAIVNPHEHGYETIHIGLAWDNVKHTGEKRGFFGRLFGRAAPKMANPGIDLDLGCLYELKDGSRGCVQAFGKMFGAFRAPPYIGLSGDERTGDADGHDESLLVNGAHWGDIKRILLYTYIYRGTPDWSVVRPQAQIMVPGEDPLIITPAVGKAELAICALGLLENIRDGIKLTHLSEYFHGHAEMDRAFGFGISWADGKKD